MASLKHWGDPPRSIASRLDGEVTVDCGWGRLIFGQTFQSNTRLAKELANETPGQRDLALYTHHNRYSSIRR